MPPDNVAQISAKISGAIARADRLAQMLRRVEPLIPRAYRTQFEQITQELVATRRALKDALDYLQ